MTSTKQPDLHTGSASDLTVDLDPEDARIRKRTEIGLSPLRPTAKAAPQRPRDAGPPSVVRWLVYISLAGLVVIALLLGQVTWQRLRGSEGSEQSASQPTNGPLTARLHVQDDFSPPILVLAEQVDQDRWAMGFVDGRYRIRSVKPGHLSWTTLGVPHLGATRISTMLELPSETPWAYGGFLARFQDGQNFYLFAVDGSGQFQVVLQKDGVWTDLRSWTPGESVRPAGQTNTITVEDDGMGMRFYADGDLLYEVTEIRLPRGDYGLAGGAQSEAGIQVDFEWVQIYRLE